jgi:DNA polymerase-4
LIRHFGKSGRFFYKIVRGIDDREVEPNRETKSVGAEDTFPFDLITHDEMIAELQKIASVVHDRLQRQALRGRTVTLKIKFSDFTLITRSKSFAVALNDFETILETATQLLESVDMENKRVRLLGISLSNFRSEVKERKDPRDQLSLGL